MNCIFELNNKEITIVTGGNKRRLFYYDPEFHDPETIMVASIILGSS